MSMLTEEQYEQYIRLLRAWVDAEKALEGPGEADPEAAQAARQAHAAVQSFRAQHGLAGEGAWAAPLAPAYSRRRRQAEA